MDWQMWFDGRLPAAVNVLNNNPINGNELFVVFAIIATPFLVICLVLIFLILRANRMRRVSKDWPSTNGHILTSYIDKHKGSASSRFGGRATFYTPRVTYQYTVNGQTYTSHGIRVSVTLGYGSVKMAESIVSKYPEGSVQTVYYDPARPEKAILERDASEANRVMIWAVLFILMMLAVVAFGLLGLSGWGR